MIQFIKDLYLTGFVLLYRLRPSQKSITRAVRAVSVLTLIEWLILAGIASLIDISIGSRFLLSSVNSRLSSKLIIIALLFALYFVNYRVLAVRGHGVNFVHKFDNMKKTRRILLISGFCALALFTIVFFVCTRLAYQNFFHIHL